MEMSITTYEYRPLQSPSIGDEIRVVEIQPGSYSDENINCNIVHISRSNPATKYEALSYTWGDASKPKYITINMAHIFPVTPNCFDAIRRLRKESVARTVWIDAICINQEDMEERIQQVRLMGEIYRKASPVVVYIGEEDEHSKRIFDHVSSICNEETDYGSSNRYGRNQHLPDVAIVDSLKQLLQRPWFTRVWVLQEVYQGQSEEDAFRSIIVCGRYSLPWKSFANCLMSVCKYRASTETRFRLLPPFPLKIGSSFQFGHNLLSLLSDTRYAAATDPRDKYFGILSLIEDDAEALVLSDYSHNTTGVYTAVGIHLVKKFKLGLLQAVRHPHSRFPALASWIPDWSRKIDSDPGWLVSNQEGLFASKCLCDIKFLILACCQSATPTSDHSYHPVLSVQGFRVDRITSLGKTFDFERSSKDCWDLVNPLWGDGIQRESEMTTPYCPPSINTRQLNRVLWTRCHHFSRYKTDEFVEPALHNCRIFSGEKGVFGLAPHEAEVGDVICEIRGAVQSCLLRKREDGDWTLISGDCYIRNLGMPAGASGVDDFRRELLGLDGWKEFILGEEERFDIW